MREGEFRGNERTGIGAYSTFRASIEHNLSKGFPLMTHKRVSLRLVAAELLWFLSGRTDVGYLHALNCRIWDGWADEDGQLGPIYGEQWRGKHDQLSKVIGKIMTNPNSRRLLVCSWNPSVEPDESLLPDQNPKLGKQALPPCHYSYQFYVTNEGHLHLQANLRSADLLVGTPYNLASYALLLHLVAYMTGKTPGTVYLDMADCHIYKNFSEDGSTETIINRQDNLYPLPTFTPDFGEEFKLSDGDNIPQVLNRLKDVEYARTVLDKIVNGLSNYQHHPSIKMKVAI